MSEAPASPNRLERPSSLERVSLKNLEILTFTGLDYQTDFPTIWRIGERYPKVEFGVLLGRRAGEPDARRYPDLKEIKWWRGLSRKSHHSLAIHLCGRFARAALGQPRSGEEVSLTEVLELCKGFDRVQINAPEYDQLAVSNFAEQVECSKVILQKREPFKAGWVLPDPKVEYLFDLSGGRGLDSLDDWPTPRLGEGRCGYAGGLNINNILHALEFVSAHPDNRFWLDMESGVRTGNDWLNLHQIEAICELVFPDL